MMNQNNPVSFRVYPLGDTAIVLEFGNTIHYDIHKKVGAFSASLAQHAFPGMIEYVPAFTTITIFYDPWIISKYGKLDAYQEIVSIINQLAINVREKEESIARLIHIPVCYGREFGPDLADAARHSSLAIEQVIAIHSNVEYLVYMIGFAPGFPYLGGMDERIAMPRKATPRHLIPAGSVGIAGLQTGVYPIETPGGWQLIGRTPISLFDPLRHPPTLLQAGDKIRFIPITREEYQARKEKEDGP